MEKMCIRDSHYCENSSFDLPWSYAMLYDDIIENDNTVYLVVEKDGRIIGHVMYMRSEIHADDGRVIPAMTFGPVSIPPEYQRRGCGSALLRHSMEAAVGPARSEEGNT